MPHSFPQVLYGRHYLAWIAGGFLAGIFYGIYGDALPFLPLLTQLCFAFALLLLVGFLFLLLRRWIPAKDFLLVFLLVLSFLLGIFRVYGFDLVQQRSLQNTAGAEYRYTGVVLDTPTPSSSGKTLGCTVRIIRSDDTEVNGKVRLYAKPEFFQGIYRGSAVSFWTKLSTPSGASFPGGFDYRHHLYRQGIRYSVVTETLSPAETQMTPKGLAYHLETMGRSIRESVFTIIDRCFGSRTEEAALLKGLLLGNRESFTDEQTEAYTDSGLVHITAASGMHVMFLFGFLSFLAGRLRIPRWLLRLLTLPVLLIFAAAAAFTPSICRAVMMLSLMLLATQFQKEPDGLTSLSFAALVLAVFNPYIITGYSFLLSFAATLGITVFVAPIHQWITRVLPDTRRLSKPASFLLDEVKSSAELSLASTVGIGYFSARFFNRFTWGSILGNILLVPLASVSFVGAIFLWGIGSLSQTLGGHFAQGVLWIPLWLMNRLADFFSLPFFRFYLPTPHTGFLLVYLPLCGMLYHYLTQRKR